MDKFINKINDFLQNWLINNDFFDLKCEFGLDFAFFYEKNIISWAFLVPAAHDELFLQFCFENGLNYNCDNFILSFFHEIGHYETIDFLTEKEIQKSERIAAKAAHDLNDYLNYYNSPVEKEATLWAISFINENPKVVEDFWSDLRPLIQEFYDAF